jgi:hypothetical protein
MAIIRLSGGVTPGNGADPRSFPAIFNAAADYIENGFRYAGTRYFFSDGSFAKADPLGTGDIGLRAIRVRMVGGGGGSGGAATTTSTQIAMGGAGGGGTYAERFIADMSLLSSSESVTVGSGGSGGAAGANNGTAGAQSSFGLLLTASGGNFGFGGSAAVPSSAIAVVGEGANSSTNADLTIAGQSGFGSFPHSTSVDFVNIGTGGGTPLSPGNNARLVGIAANGSTPSNSFGRGATGGFNNASQSTARAGAAGAAGIVIVDCFV